MAFYPHVCHFFICFHQNHAFYENFPTVRTNHEIKFQRLLCIKCILNFLLLGNRFLCFRIPNSRELYRGASRHRIWAWRWKWLWKIQWLLGNIALLLQDSNWGPWDSQRLLLDSHQAKWSISKLNRLCDLDFLDDVTILSTDSILELLNCHYFPGLWARPCDVSLQ